LRSNNLGKASLKKKLILKIRIGFCNRFADGFSEGAVYSAGCMGAGIISYGISGKFNGGYGWSSGQWQGGYQTPNTPGIFIVTHQGCVNGGRS